MTAKIVRIGEKTIGRDCAVLIQSMTNTDTKDIEGTVLQIRELEKAGCEAVRISIPDVESAKCISQIKEQISIPLIADIHFDHKLALMAIEEGIDKIRLNPGNIGADWKVREVALAAKDKAVPIRVGVNWGSVPTKLKHTDSPEAIMVDLAEAEISLLDECGFDDIVVSLKASSVPIMVEANRVFSRKYDYPLHLGITEAGLAQVGTIKSAIGIGMLLAEGIGDTIRVSLTGDPVMEIPVAKSILEALQIRHFKGVKIVSCPTCARKRIEVEHIAKAISEKLADIEEDITVAVMGCEVNGPGEAREADIGVAGGKGYAILFEKGEIIGRIDQEKLIDEFIERIRGLSGI